MIKVHVLCLEHLSWGVPYTFQPIPLYLTIYESCCNTNLKLSKEYSITPVFGIWNTKQFYISTCAFNLLFNAAIYAFHLIEYTTGRADLHNEEFCKSIWDVGTKARHIENLSIYRPLYI